MPIKADRRHKRSYSSWAMRSSKFSLSCDWKGPNSRSVEKYWMSKVYYQWDYENRGNSKLCSYHPGKNRVRNHWKESASCLHPTWNPLSRQETYCLWNEISPSRSWENQRKKSNRNPALWLPKTRTCRSHTWEGTDQRNWEGNHRWKVSFHQRWRSWTYCQCGSHHAKAFD